MARAPTSYNQCLTAVELAAGRELRDSELERIFEQLDGAARRYQAEGMTETEAFVRAGRELGNEMKLAAAIEKRNRLRNALVKRELDNKIGIGAEAQAFRRLFMETDAAQAGRVGMLIGPFTRDLEAAGLVKVLGDNDPAFQRQVWRELGAVQAGKPAITGNALARKAAEIITTHQERARLMLNDAGAWIGKRDDFLTRQVHDADKIELAGHQKWHDFILPRLDPRTFDGVEDQGKFLESVYKALASGLHDHPNGRVAWGDVGAGTGPANLAKRVSQERKLIFKDADARADYQGEFGSGTLMNVVTQGLETAGRNTALMQIWGPNPEAMHETVRKMALARAKDRSDFAQVKLLQRDFDDKIFAAMSGALAADARQLVPGFGWLGRVTYGNLAAGALALNTMSKLGGVVVSSIPDLASNAAVARHNGISIWQAYSNQLRSLMPSQGRRETAQLAGVGTEAVLSTVAARFHAMSAGTGWSAYLVDKFHKWNLLTWWTESMRTGMATLLTNNMGRLAGTTFDALDPRLRYQMQRYGITASDWNAARATARDAADGNVHVLPAHIDDANVAPKFYAYINDQVRDAMNEPDAWTRAFTTWGQQAGTPLGAAARILMQFKTYPVTFTRRAWMREFRGENGMDVAGIAHLMVATTLLGYAAMEMKQLARGRDPRAANVDDVGDAIKTGIAAMAQGGGFGIYGDFVFGDTSRTGSGPVISMFGPTVGAADDLAKLIQNLRKGFLEGDAQSQRDARSGAFGFVRENAPFVNMFYTRAILDYFFWYRMQEAFNPGYLSRYEDRMRREHDQTFMLSPTASPYRAMGLTP